MEFTIAWQFAPVFRGNSADHLFNTEYRALRRFEEMVTELFGAGHWEVKDGSIPYGRCEVTHNVTTCVTAIRHTH